MMLKPLKSGDVVRLRFGIAGVRVYDDDYNFRYIEIDSSKDVMIVIKIKTINKDEWAHLLTMKGIVSMNTRNLASLAEKNPFFRV